jgi:16S rRNA C967 or C1407 C5-methylase (RsmB/RsmF family)
MAKGAQFLCDLAAGILEAADTTHQGGGLKNLLYAADCPNGMRAMLLAVVNGASKEKDQLLAVAEESGFLAGLPAACEPLPQYLLQVYLYEALLGSRRVRGIGPLLEYVQSRKVALQQTLAARRKRGATNSFAEKLSMPRYARVNLLLATCAEAEAYVAATYGVAFVQHRPLPGTASAAGVSSNALCVAAGTALWDPLVPGLLVLPPKTTFHGDPWVEAGKLVLQDRASCLSAWALSPPAGSAVLDTCAAPGNKTLHLASLMGGVGTVAAFERSGPRLATLRRRVAQHGAADVITCHGADFMLADVAAPTGPHAHVTHVLLDPSCSGSGLVRTYAQGEAPLQPGAAGDAASGPRPGGGPGGGAEHDGPLYAGHDPAGVAALAKAQREIILHAMQLPHARVVVYSTCSVLAEENEEVVLGVLSKSSQHGFALVTALPSWPHRGLADSRPEYAAIGPKVVRADFSRDATNGFFVARFERPPAAAEPPGTAGTQAEEPQPLVARAEKKEKEAKKQGRRKEKKEQREKTSEAQQEEPRAQGKKRAAEADDSAAERGKEGEAERAARKAIKRARRQEREAAANMAAKAAADAADAAAEKARKKTKKEAKKAKKEKRSEPLG